MKYPGKYLTKLILILSLLSNLILFLLFQQNIKQNTSTCFENPVVKVDPTRQSFAKIMSLFPWLPYKNATIHNDIPEIKKYSESLLTSILIPFITKEPPTSINTSCEAPPLPSKPEKCVSLNNGTSPKIGVILSFGFDVDALEVHLHELDYLVDNFFLVEGLKINNRILGAKPSVWDLVKDTPRFSQFRPKIVHFIVDDADYHEVEGTTTPGIWDREHLQGKIRLRKFLEWNKATGRFSSEDWIGIGDTDEIPSRQAINLLKNCEMQGDDEGGVDIGIWFPFLYDNTIYKTDLPVISLPYTLGNPTYWKVSAVERIYKNGSCTGRRAGRGKNYLLGGMHFSNFPYLPFQLTKLITGSESEVNGIKWAIEIGMTYFNGSDIEDGDLDKIAALETAALYKWEGPKTRNNRHYVRTVKSLKRFREIFGDKITDDIVKIPWFYQCNSGRYPGFRKGLDKRLFYDKQKMRFS